MRKLLLIALAAFSAVSVARAQVVEKEQEVNLDEEFFTLPEQVTNDYLDSISIKKTAPNNYWILGAYGGVGLNYGMFNPVRYVRWVVQYPTYGFSVIRYFSMFGRFPNMGLELGAQMNYEGYVQAHQGNGQYFYRIGGLQGYDAGSGGVCHVAFPF